MGERGDLDLTFIGSGNAFGDARCYSGFVLNGHTLFDCPPTAVYGLKLAAVPMAAIDTVVLSHFHGDHFFGLPFLLLEYTFPGAAGGRTPRRTRDLTIAGPPGVADIVERVCDLAFPNLLHRSTTYRRHYVELAPGSEVEVNHVRLGAARMNHAGDSLDLALGYRIETGGRTLAYTGDTAWCDNLVALGQSAEVYVCDANYPSGRNLPEHLSLDEIRDLRRLVQERTHLILTHLGHDQIPDDLPRTVKATDGGRIRFA